LFAGRPGSASVSPEFGLAGTIRRAQAIRAYRRDPRQAGAGAGAIRRGGRRDAAGILRADKRGSVRFEFFGSSPESVRGPRLLGLRSPWGPQPPEGAAPHGGIARPGPNPGERNQGPGARVAGDRLKPTAPAVGRVRGSRNHPAKRAKESSRRFLSPASRACSPLSCHPQLGRRGDWAGKLPPAPQALLHQELPVGPAYLGAGRQFSVV
jgi:hypothetical protein